MIWGTPMTQETSIIMGKSVKLGGLTSKNPGSSGEKSSTILTWLALFFRPVDLRDPATFTEPLT